MEIQIIQEAGLTATEAKIYLALLELSSAQAGEITKKSAVNRTNVYDALERLIEKGLVSFVVSANKKMFEPVNPTRLKEILQEKQEKIQQVLPKLQELYKQTKSEEDATIFKGKKGIKSIFQEMLKQKSNIFVYGAESRFKEMFPFYQKHWNDERAKKKINMKIIYNEKVKNEKQKENLKLATLKFLPAHYDFPSTIIIYTNKVITIVWTETPLGFMITSKEVVKSNLNFFDLLWKQAKP